MPDKSIDLFLIPECADDYSIGCDNDEVCQTNDEHDVEMNIDTTVIHDPNDVAMVTEENSSSKHPTTTSTDNSEQESMDENGMSFSMTKFANGLYWYFNKNNLLFQYCSKYIFIYH